jgi:hypothetical protein
MPCRGRFVGWLLLVVASSGCAEGVCVNQWEQPSVSITGRVTYRGYPLDGGQIVFVADQDYGAGTGLLAVELGHDGRFVLQDGRQSGLKPGYYRITLSSGSRARMQIPRRYCDPVTSGLRCQVETAQPLRLNIELE